MVNKDYYKTVRFYRVSLSTAKTTQSGVYTDARVANSPACLLCVEKAGAELLQGLLPPAIAASIGCFMMAYNIHGCCCCCCCCDVIECRRITARFAIAIYIHYAVGRSFNAIHIRESTTMRLHF